MSFVTVFDMTLGDFNVETFRKAPCVSTCMLTLRTGVYLVKPYCVLRSSVQLILLHYTADSVAVYTSLRNDVSQLVISGRYWLLPVGVFLMFMVTVPVVMLNALIAIMVRVALCCGSCCAHGQSFGNQCDVVCRVPREIV